jgi:hypothetical protein
MSMPTYPNWGATLGSYGPVVGALLSGVSTASFVAALAHDLKTEKIDLLITSWDTRISSMVFGVCSTILMILATFAFLYAQASDFESMPNEKQERIFSKGTIGESDKESWRNRYRSRSVLWLAFAEMWLLGGFVSLLLGLASLTLPYTRALSIVLGAISLFMCFFELGFGDSHELGLLRKFVRAVFLIALGILSGLLMIAAIRS